MVRVHGERLRTAQPLTGEQLAALRAIARCRTPDMGGIRESCAECGEERMLWRSCRNRHCPKCQTVAKERWLDNRLAELLPVDYVHVVFTLPHDLNRLALLRPRLVYGILFRAAANSLLEFAQDPRYLGAEPGIITVLHTWGQSLTQHIHLHCIVTAGGLDRTRRRWVRGRAGYLFPVRALSRVFRGKYLEALNDGMRNETGLAEPIPQRELWSKEWVVYAKKPFGGPRHVLEYLARYTHRVALTNDRLLDLTDEVVSLRCRDYAHGNKRKILRLHPVTLLGRFMLHVLPRGFCRIRHYGLLGNRHKASKLTACRRYFGTAVSETHQETSTRSILLRMAIYPGRCPACGGLKLHREPIAATHPRPRARDPTCH